MAGARTIEKNSFRIRAFKRTADLPEDRNTIHILVQDMSKSVSIETEVLEGQRSIFDLFDERKATPKQHKLMEIAQKCMENHAKNAGEEHTFNIPRAGESIIVGQAKLDNHWSSDRHLRLDEILGRTEALEVMRQHAKHTMDCAKGSGHKPERSIVAFWNIANLGWTTRSDETESELVDCTNRREFRLAITPSILPKETVERINAVCERSSVRPLLRSWEDTLSGRERRLLHLPVEFHMRELPVLDYQKDGVWMNRKKAEICQGLGSQENDIGNTFEAMKLWAGQNPELRMDPRLEIPDRIRETSLVDFSLAVQMGLGSKQKEDKIRNVCERMDLDPEKIRKAAYRNAASQYLDVITGWGCLKPGETKVTARLANVGFRAHTIYSALSEVLSQNDQNQPQKEPTQLDVPLSANEALVDFISPEYHRSKWSEGICCHRRDIYGGNPGNPRNKAPATKVRESVGRS